MTRLQGILAAGGLTAIVLLAAVVMAFQSFSQASAAGAAPVVIPVSQQTSSATDASTQALIREYQAQLEQANQTIRQLQAERDQLARMLRGQTSHDEEHENEGEWNG